MLLDRGWCCLFTILVAVLVQKVSQTPEKHSLIYYYTELAKDLSPLGFTEFTALGLLDDRKLYYYDGKNQITGAEQDWKKEDLNVDHLIQNSEELQWLRDWFRKQSQIVANCTWPCPDLHVLQRRFGCEVEERQDGSVQFFKAVEEYGFDGEDLITFDTDALQWKAEVPKARTIKMIWDKEQGRNLRTGIYLKNECRENLFKSLSFSSGRRKTPSAPGFHNSVFPKMSFGKTTLTLICMASGFYPKDLKMRLRRFNTSLPDHLLTSSGFRPNGDGTYQLRKSVYVQEEDAAGYDCRIEHSSLDSPVTVPWVKNWIEKRRQRQVDRVEDGQQEEGTSESGYTLVLNPLETLALNQELEKP
ncbi:zinc-alpha-2-glycoprotein-like [Hoplias malabaricus]|uniref:zinc-alpha-2-glycoprotein-like n=1 Tax=Hoplias malabaricus TaxID=27720 RepID=UPI0034634DB9